MSAIANELSLHANTAREKAVAESPRMTLLHKFAVALADTMHNNGD